MRLIVHGMSNKRVAYELGISEVTVQIHRGRIKQKLELKSLAALVRVAIGLGIAPSTFHGRCSPCLRMPTAFPL